MRDGGSWLLAFLILATGSSAGAAPDPQADPSGWSAAVEREIADSEYRLTWQEETALAGLEAAWQAPNRAHGIRTYFTGDGIRVVPRSTDGASWEWGLSLVRVCRPGSAGLAEAARFSVAGPAAEYDRGSVVERYVNDRRGLEQLFAIEDAPAGARGPVHLDLALSGTLSPVIAEDGQAIDFATPDGGKVLHYASLLVVDARGTVLRSWIEGVAEPGLSGIRLVYDDVGAVYPVTVDPLTTSAAWSAEADQGSAWFGNSVATAGDVDGDGYSDVLVGAPFFDAGENDEGRAYLYLGAPSGARTSFSWRVESDQAGASYGWSVGPAGDVNGDGYADVIVGAFQHANGGKAYVYLGSATGLSSSAAWTVEGGQSGAWLGHSVGTAGDVNGDGFADIIVGASAYSNDQGNEGRAYVYHGSASGPAVSASWTAEGDQVGALLGGSVGTAGDVNADGFADVIVGADGYDDGQTNEGRALVYLGSASGLAPSPAWAVESNQAASLFASSVATAGDVNGDGYADVIVGAYSYDNGQTDEGRVFVYLGSATGLSTTVAWTRESDLAGARFGYAVAPAGDVNGDGYADVIVGASGYNGFGRTFVYSGSALGLLGPPAWTADSNQSSAGLQGMSVSTAGDVNGDGFSDVIVGYSQYDNPEANEGRAFLYHGSASTLALPAAWAVTGDQASEWLGFAVGTAGDVDGDGYSEIVVGAPNYDNGLADQGRVYVYRGSASGLATTAAWILEGDQENPAFGWSVATAGDVNGDGYSDVIVGANQYTNGQLWEGAAFVYLGSPEGLVTTPAWIAESDHDIAQFGFSVATAGDVNGDGYSDVIVGAYHDEDGQNDEGRAYVYHGSATGLAATPAWSAESDQASAYFGTSVATAGDVNGDGYSDVLVGAQFYDSAQSSVGSAYLYLGSATGLGTNPVWMVEGDQLGAGLGASVATAGDVNGDGYADVVIGASSYDNGQTQEGRAYLYLGSSAGLGPNASWTAEGNQANAYFGHSARAAGDVNGDGYADVVVGASGYLGVGRAFVYHGSAAGLATAPAFTADGDQSGAAFAVVVAPAGDVNGDAYADIIVGAHLYDRAQPDGGFAALYYGGGGDGLDRIPRQARSDDTAPIAVLGKSDSETGFRLPATGRSPAGRDRVRLEWQVQRLGAPFGGAGRETSLISDTGAPTAEGSAVSLSEPVTGLVEGAFYHWRSRIVSANPYFPRSPWMSLAGNNGTETKLRTAGCIDTDGDGFGALADPSCTSVGLDCGETDAVVHPGAPEVNDGQDNQCAGDPGHGVGDEVTGTISLGPGGTLCWTDASGADAFEVARSTSPDFVPCEIILGAGPGPCTSDPDTPPPGEAFYYLVRATSPYVGSWGQASNGLEHTLACGVMQSLDQANLVPIGHLPISHAQQLAQNIFVNTTGRLSGVEIAPVRLSLLPTDTILLDVYRGPTLLATASLAAAGFPSSAAEPLDAQNGPGYVNLSPFGIAVEVGQTIKLVLRPGWSPDTCDGFFCAASGKVCTGTFQCDRSAAAGTNNGYPSGTLSINGTPVPNLDLVFKTLVLH